MKYKYYSFVNNRSIDDAVKIFKQRLDDAKYIYKKYSKDFVTRECPYCGSDKGEKVDSFHNMYSIDKCRICNSPFVNPAPTLEAISDYYESCKCNRQLSQVIKKRYDSNDFINDYRVELICAQIDKIKHNGERISILEVGCNNGAFLSKLHQVLQNKYKNYFFEIDGMDIDSDAINNPVDKEINLFHGFAEDVADIYPGKYDLIIHFELIEHLINPIAFVNSIHKMLKPKGMMAFTTPNGLGLDNQALGYNKTRYLAHSLFPPMHLNAFSTQNIAHFLITGGFMVDEIETPGLLDMDILNLCIGDIDNNVYKDIANLDKDTRALIQAFLIKMKMSSHMQCIAIKA